MSSTSLAAKWYVILCEGNRSLREISVVQRPGFKLVAKAEHFQLNAIMLDIDPASRHEEAVRELTNQGLTTRKIGEVLGVGHATVARDKVCRKCDKERPRAKKESGISLSQMRQTRIAMPTWRIMRAANAGGNRWCGNQIKDRVEPIWDQILEIIDTIEGFRNVDSR